MTKIAFFYSIVLLSCLSCSEPALKMNFAALEKANVILFNTQNLKTDTVQVYNGSLTFDIELKKPTLFLLTVDGYNNTRPMRFLLSENQTTIEFESFKKSVGNGDILDIYPNHPKFISDPNKNAVFYDFQQKWLTFYKQIENLSSSESSDLLEVRKNTYNSFLDYCDSLIKNSNKDYISAIVIDRLVQDNLLQLQTIQSYYDHLDLEVKDSFLGLKIGEFAGNEGSLQPGKPAPKFKLTAFNQQELMLDKFRGNMVLLHFWSSSCAPCIKEAPDLILLNKDFKDKLNTINISLDLAEGKWLKGIERAGIGNMYNVCDLKGFNGNVVQDYGINVIPAYFLIDEKGMIILKGSLNQVKEKLTDISFKN